MDWRAKLTAHLGPGLLGGATFGDWIKLLRDQSFAVDLSRIPRVLAITSQSLKNSAFRWHEARRYGPLLKDVKIAPPLFILGHWRNGTTHLHQLLAQDRQFAFPNTYQTFFPHIFLTTEAFGVRALSLLCPKRRPMDNMELGLTLPQEDEFAVCISSFKSPCLAWIFPRHKERFEKYLTFQKAEEKEVAEWRAALELFLKKLTWKYQRPLVLKSPPHTCRIRLLLEMFPGAKFVHIHRNPYPVFQSTRRTFQLMFQWQGLQRPRLGDLDDWILRQYKEMYEVFFDERKLAPDGSFHEIAFEDLEKDPIGEVRRLYGALGLSGLEQAEPEIRRYVDSVADYKKNVFPDLPPELKARIGCEWRACFEEWGYPLSCAKQ